MNDKFDSYPIYPYICALIWEITIKDIKRHEENISAVATEKKEQAWVQGAHEYC